MNKQYIFNSLGSSYNWVDALVAMKALFSPNKHAQTQLSDIIREWFPKFYVTPVYKGRDALEIALKSLGVGIGDIVLTQAFSCYAIEEAIVRCGAHPLYYDVLPDSLVPNKATLDQAMLRLQTESKNKKLVKVIIAQFSMGNVSAERVIREWAHQNQIAYIADLAQAIGCQIGNEYVGTDADAVVLSSGRDKILDGVSGGFVLTRQPLNTELLTKQVVGTWQTARDCLYPFLSQLIRFTYPIQLGRVIHLLMNKMGIFYSPIVSIYTQPAQMSATLATFLLHRWSTVESEKAHRRQIAEIYHQTLERQSLIEKADILTSSNLRYPLSVESPAKSIQHLEKEHIFIADRWYRHPVDSGAIGHQSEYVVGSCPNAEVAAKHCINLPTHRGVSPEKAYQIAQLLL